MKKICLIIFTVFLSVNVHATTIKLATLAPEGSPWYNIIREMSEKWTKISNGTITVKIYASGISGDESDMVRKMRIGQLQSAAITTEGLSYITSEMNALQMPMLISTYEELDYIFEKLSKKLEEKIEAKGFKVLNWGDVGWVRFFSQKKVIFPDDLKDQALFVWSGDTNVSGAWKDAGFRIVTIAPTDILTSLQTKMINAFSTTPLVALSFQWFALANEMTDMKWAPFIGATVISLKTWTSIPENLRIEMEKIAKESGKKMKKDIREMDNKAIEIMEKNGLKINHIPDNALTVWKTKAQSAYPRLLNTPEIKETFEEIKKLHEEFMSRKK